MSEEHLDHQEWDELAAGYALDALDADEELRFAVHLEECERCTTSVAEHELVAAGLGAIAHPGEAADAPSWDTIRDAIVTTPQDQPTTLASRRGRHRGDRTRRLPLGAAAAAVVIAAGGITAWQLTGGGNSCGVSGGCHTVQLDAGPRTAAVLTIRGDVLSLRTTDLAIAPTGEIYALWQQPRNAKPVLVAEFTANPTQGPVSGTLRSAYNHTQQFAVSLEKATGIPPKSPSNLLATGNAA